LVFPDPRLERGFDGLIAVGGDLSVERLLLAYRLGIFPWFSEGTDILWWSPDPRTIIEMGNVHLSRSLKRRLTRGEFTFTSDKCFFDVMRACGDRSEGTWILPSMLAAYEALHRLGHAHSFEVWQDGALVGGLYGVCIGRAFAAESMFHRVTDASKAALVLAIRSLRRLGIVLFDVQYLTSHLASMGASVVPRSEYLERLDDAQRGNVEFADLVLDYGD
jgi:leucyl/phenylalanyl-tRNA--protein transferase